MAAPSARAPVKVSDLLERAVPGLGERLLVDRIRARWPEVVGAEGGRRSRPDSLRHGALTVIVDNSAWLHELTLRAAELLARVRAAHGLGVTALRFQLGRMPASPRRPAASPAAVVPAALSDDDRRDIERQTAGIADPALAAALERVLTKDRLARERAMSPARGPRERSDA